MKKMPEKLRSRRWKHCNTGKRNGAARLFSSYTALKCTDFFPNHCVVYGADIACYYVLLERICVHRKGKTHFTEETTTKKIDLFERAIAEQAGSLKDYGINGTAFWAYRKSVDAGNDLVDFSEVIWDTDIEAIADTFNTAGITEFTISSTFSSLIPTLAAFEKHGFKMAGLTEVNANYTDWQTGERARIPAIKMQKA